MPLFLIIFGLTGGIFWERWSTSPIGKRPTLLPSLKIKHREGLLHLHHWLAYVTALLILTLLFWNSQSLTHPIFLFIASFLIGALSYNFWKFPDWHKFLE